MRTQLFTIASAPFEAARQVTSLPVGHKSRRPHGHSFLATVRATEGPAWEEFSGSASWTLSTMLQECVSRLDYTDLRTLLDQPTDENLARWIRDQFARQHPKVRLTQVGVRSTSGTGVDLDARGHAHVWRRYRFQAAHRLPNVPVGHKCGRMHGHSFEVILHANQDVGTRDLSIDYDHLDDIWAPLHMQLNYHCLNEIDGLSNPTSEIISAWLWGQLKTVLPELSSVTVYETGSCGANFDGRNYRIWKEMTLDSAVRMRSAPPGHPLTALHGHTYSLRLHLQAPLDAVMGWTLDFGDVKALFDPIFKALDHQPLHELPELEECSTEHLARWAFARAKDVLPCCERIDVLEAEGAGSLLIYGDAPDLMPL